jgi:hypothetical protein
LKKRDALKSYVNVSVDSSALSASLQADLNLVADAYASTATSLIELEKAFSRIDSIAAQEGTSAAVKAFRDIAAAQKDLASTMIALRHEARATIQARAQTERERAELDPPGSGGVAGADGTTPPAKISPSRASVPEITDSNVIREQREAAAEPQSEATPPSANNPE